LKPYLFRLARAVKALAPVLACLAVLPILAQVPAGAQPPILEKPQGFEYPQEVLTNTPQQFAIDYLQTSGDKPKSIVLVVQTPSLGVIRAEPDQKDDSTAGQERATWNFTPVDTGTYKFHFEATSATGEKAQYPPAPAIDDQFTAESLTTKWIILAVGLVVALCFLPFIVYLGTRSINRKSDPSAAARIALLIGVLASYALYITLFHNVYSWLLNIIVGVAAVALLIVLFTRRR
jgi:hypothetical protein